MEKKLFIEELEPFRKIEDKYESLYSIVYHHITTGDIISDLHKRLKMLKTLKSGSKRKYINDRIFSLITFFKDKYKAENEINSICLLGKTIDLIPLTKEHLKIVKDYSINKIVFERGDTFQIDFLNCLLLDTSFKNVIHVNNNTIKHIHLNPTKKRTIYEKESKDIDVISYVTLPLYKGNFGLHKDHDRIVIHGESSHLKNIKLPEKDYLVHKHFLSDDEIHNIFKRDDMLKNHKQLENLFGILNNEKTSDRVLVGKDIVKGITSYMIKELFCTPKMYKKIFDKIDPEYLNFKFIIIESLDDGDIGDKLKKDYKGALGYTYY